MGLLKRVDERWLAGCTAAYAWLVASSTLAQAASADDVLGPAAKVVDKARLSPGWGILGGLGVIGFVACGMAFKERRLFIGAGLLMGAIVFWYGGWDIIGPLVPRSGTPAAP